jgi:hypothetical protein
MQRFCQLGKAACEKVALRRSSTERAGNVRDGRASTAALATEGIDVEKRVFNAYLDFVEKQG